jgi:hypothetical protein
LNYRICCPNVPLDLGVRQGAGAQDARRPGQVSVAGLRDRALLSVGLQVGLRRAEIAVSDLHHAAMTRCGWCARAAGATRSPSTRRPRRGCAPISNFENERLDIFDTAAAHVAFGYDIAVSLREAFERVGSRAGQTWRTDTAGGFRLPADRTRNVRHDAYISKNLRRSTKKIPQEARQCVISGSATSTPLTIGIRGAETTDAELRSR